MFKTKDRINQFNKIDKKVVGLIQLILNEVI
jgi:hypothetical protein